MLDLDEIKRLVEKCRTHGGTFADALNAIEQCPALIDEVERLESELEAALADKPADMKG